MKKQSSPILQSSTLTNSFEDKRISWIRQISMSCAALCVCAVVLLCLTACQADDSSATNETFVNTSDRPFAVVPFAGELPSTELRSSDEMIVFEGGDGFGYNYLTGIETACFFDVEGEGIEYVDVVLSNGAFAAAIKEVYVEGDREYGKKYVEIGQWPNTEIYRSEDEAYQSALANLGGTDDQDGLGIRASGGMSSDRARAISFTNYRTVGDTFSYQPGRVDEETGIDFSKAKLNIKLDIESLAPLLEMTISAEDLRESYQSEIDKIERGEIDLSAYTDPITNEQPSKEEMIAELQAAIEDAVSMYNYVGSDRAALDLFDGETFTVTAHFDDGTKARKTYQLKTGWLKCETEVTSYVEDGLVDTTKTTIFPELYNQGSDQKFERENCIYTLYAVEQA